MKSNIMTIFHMNGFLEVIKYIYKYENYNFDMNDLEKWYKNFTNEDALIFFNALIKWTETQKRPPLMQHIEETIHELKQKEV